MHSGATINVDVWFGSCSNHTKDSIVHLVGIPRNQAVVQNMWQGLIAITTEKVYRICTSAWFPHRYITYRDRIGNGAIMRSRVR